MDAMMSKYFDDNQMSQLDRRRAAIGDDAIRKVEQAWPGLIARVDAAVAEGLDPASAQARQLAAEWAGLLEGFHGGDEGLRNSLFRMYEENSAQIEEQSGDLARCGAIQVARWFIGQQQRRFQDERPT